MRETTAYLVAGTLVMALFIGGSLFIHSSYMMHVQDNSCGLRGPAVGTGCIAQSHWLPAWPMDYLPLIGFGLVFGGILVTMGILPPADDQPAAPPAATSLHAHIGSDNGFMLTADAHTFLDMH